jgi:hypothetical protein
LQFLSMGGQNKRRGRGQILLHWRDSSWDGPKRAVAAWLS